MAEHDARVVANDVPMVANAPIRVANASQRVANTAAAVANIPLPVVANSTRHGKYRDIDRRRVYMREYMRRRRAAAR